MIDNKSYISIKKSSERSFGIVFSVVFLIISFYPLLSGDSIRYWSLFLAIFLFSLSLFIPNVLKTPNYIWYKFGILLGSIVAPIIMALIFFGIITPIGIFMRILGKDLINNKCNKSLKTYWIKRKIKINSMKNQF